MLESDKMKVLISGGYGFIGSHVAEKLLKQKDDVWIIDNLSAGKKANITVKEKIAGFWNFGINESFPNEHFDVIYHLAARRSVPESFKYPNEFFDVNIKGTWNLLNNLSWDRFVNISSSSAEGCLSPYGISKRAAENLAALFPDAVTLRPFNVFGDKQPIESGAVIPQFAHSMILLHESPTIFGDGEQSRDFSFVEDVADEIIRYGKGKYKKRKGVWEMGYGTPHKVNEIFSLMAEKLNFKGKPVYEKERKGEVKTTKAKHIIKDTYGFNRGLEETIEWYKSYFEYHSQCLEG